MLAALSARGHAARRPRPLSTGRRRPFLAAERGPGFVARIFADVGAADEPEAAAPVAETEPAAAAGLPPRRTHHRGDGADDQRVLVLGLGASRRHGAWCVRCGAQVIVADTRKPAAARPAAGRAAPGGVHRRALGR